MMSVGFSHDFLLETDVARLDAPQETIREDAGKPTLSAATPIIPMPKQVSEYSSDEPRDAIRHDAGKLTPKVTTYTVLMPTKYSE
jgi:hypothetical protein